MSRDGRPLPAARLAGLAAAAAGGGCGGIQSALAPRGPAAAELHTLWVVLLVVTLAGAVPFIVLFLVALWRGRRRTEARRGSPLENRAILLGGAVFPAVLLLVILFWTVRAGSRTGAIPGDPALTVEVVGHQYWWEVRYPEFGGSSANELHIPAGRPVRLRLTSADVIHSFWVPALHGKKDMIPGAVTELWLQADAPGVFRGQCAEFCGLQHAKMAFHVVAHPPGEAERVLRGLAGPAAAPDDPAGAAAFSRAGCPACHRIRGVVESTSEAVLGPDLTHLASRRTLGAATLDNTPGNLAGWILDPQHHKPGNRMPPTPITPAELHALLGFLGGLR